MNVNFYCMFSFLDRTIVTIPMENLTCIRLQMNTIKMIPNITTIAQDHWFHFPTFPVFGSLVAIAVKLTLLFRC